MSNLTQRILTAVVLLALFIPALAVKTPWPFWLLTLLLIGAAAWEWSRLNGWTGGRAWASGVFCVACAAGLAALLSIAGDAVAENLKAAGVTSISLGHNDWANNPVAVNAVNHFKWFVAVQFAAFGVVCLLWIIGGAWLLWRGVTRWPALPQWLRWSIGMAMLSVAWVALAVARTWGVGFLLSVLALVWAADIGAYAFGRTLGGKLTGGRKLAPSISPGKTWEGALGGFFCVLLVGAVWTLDFERLWRSVREGWLDLSGVNSSSLYTSLWWQGGPVWFVCVLALLTAMSIVGDLFESLVKRAAGAKDSSQLLPGHGGVLDRIDALLPTLPLVVTIVVYLHWLMLLLQADMPK